jgi:PAS domain S-box-containing protein
MATHPKPARGSIAQSQLRERAEALVSHEPESSAHEPPNDLTRLLHELHVHQSELQVQNDELRRIQLDLERSRDRFAFLYDHAPVGFLTLDPRGVVQEANLTASNLLNLPRATLLQKKLSSFVSPQSQDDLYLHLQQVFSTRSKRTCELHLHPTDAPALTGRLESVPMPFSEGHTPLCLTALSDVTRQHQAEAALHESQTRLAGIIRLAMDAIILVDSQHRIVLFNEAAQSMFGHPADQITGQPLDRLIPPRFRKAHPGHLRHFGQNNVTSRTMGERGQVSGLRADGREFPMEASISHMDANGQQFFTVIARDITTRLEKEKALRQNEAALTDFFREAPLGLLWVAADGRILLANRAQLDLLGRASDDVIGHNIAEFFIESDLASDTLEQLSRKKTIKHHRVRFHTRSGAIVHALIDANGLWDEGRLVHTRWFVRDVTFRVQLEREILKTGEREQQRLGRELHDDLCQQLSSIEFLAHSLAMDLSMKSADDARRSSEIARLLREANARTRTLSHGLAPMHLAAEGLVGALEDLAQRTRTVFRRECNFHCPKPVRIDDLDVAQHLYRIAQEAVGNAIKHGKATRIDLELVRNGSRLVLGIKDDGLGLSKSAGRKKGMGLRIMQYRAGVISGSLVVQKQPGSGTAVVCSVPDSIEKRKRKRKP